MMISYVIRTVGVQDQTLLWCWRNDPVTREMERIPGILSPQTYASQLSYMLSNDNYRVFMAETETNALAVSYIYSSKGETAEIGICVNPAFRGLGLACGLLRAFTATAQTELGFERISAKVKVINIPSCRLFSRAGYHVDTIKNEVVYFSRDMNDSQGKK